MAHETKTAAQDLELLKKIADGEVDVDIPRDGFPLPEGFDNPPSGSLGHRCLQRMGEDRLIYRKEWYCLKLHKVDGMPTRQAFNCAGRKYRVLVGVWADVPREVVNVLSMAVVQDVKHSIDITDVLGSVDGASVIDETPRFSYSVIPSA